MAVRSDVKIVRSSGDLVNFEGNVVYRECVEAGIDNWTARDAALAVSSKIFSGMTTRGVQETLEKVLNELNPSAAERYKRFHSMLVRTSKNTIEHFDRRQITVSLIRETKLPKELAESIAKESEEELRRLKLDFVSAPLIREVVNVKLLEHGLEDARADYTRLGMPVYDAAQLIESKGNGIARSPQAINALLADNVLREYALLKVLPLHQADAHMRGEIHVHALEYFASRPDSLSHDLKPFLKNGLVIRTPKGEVAAGQPKNPEVAILQVLKLFEASKDYVAGRQFVDHFNYLLAPFVAGLAESEIARLAETMVYELSQRDITSLIGLDYSCPAHLSGSKAVGPGESKGEYEDYQEAAGRFAVAIIDVLLQGDRLGNDFPNPEVMVRAEKGGGPEYRAFMKNVHELALKRSGLMFSSGEGEPGRGNLGSVTLNLPRVAYESADREKFYEILEDRLNLAREVLMVKREVMKKRVEQGLLSFLTQNVGDEQYYSLDDAENTIAILGVNEAAKAMTGSQMHESNDAWKFGLDAVRHTSKLLAEWNKETQLRWIVAESDAEVAHRLAKLDYGLFSDRAVIGDPTNPSYVPGSHLSRTADVKELRRLQMEGVFHSHCRMVSVANIEESSPDALLKLTEKILEDTEVKYWRYGG